MAIPNKQVFSHGDTIRGEDINALQDNFEQWVANHYHSAKKLPILTLTSETKVDALIGNEKFLYNFTNQVINTDVSFAEYEPTYLILKLSYLSELYNQSVLLGKENLTLKELIYGYAGSYFTTEDTKGNIYNVVFKNATMIEDELDIVITVPSLRDGSNNIIANFTYQANSYVQKSQTIHVKKDIIKDFTYSTSGSTSTLTLDLDIQENAYIGLPALPLSPKAVMGKSGKVQVSAASHVSDTSKHVSVFASEVGLMETAKRHMLAYPTITSKHPLYTEGKFLATSNDKFLSLNVVKNEAVTNRMTQLRSQDRPLDAMFRGTSTRPTWLKDDYFTTETRKDAKFVKSNIEDGFNYSIAATENSGHIQTFEFQDFTPTKTVEGVTSYMYNSASGESRALRVRKDTRFTTTQNGASLAQLPVSMKLEPNRQTSAYMYTFYYGKKLQGFKAKSYLGDYSGSPLYLNHRSNFEYNINKKLFYEKVLILGSPYESHNVGAEHIYTKRVAKDFSNPNASFNGYLIEDVDLATIKAEEQRIL